MGIAYHRRVEIAAPAEEATLTLRLDGPFARPTALLGGRLIRRYLDTEADGLRREAERDSAR